MKNVYFDDLRPPPKGFVWVKNVEDCLSQLKQNEVNFLSLDHDILTSELDGYELVKRMSELNLWAKKIYLHSGNGEGRMKMYYFLLENKPEWVSVYNCPLPFHFDEEE